MSKEVQYHECLINYEGVIKGVDTSAKLTYIKFIMGVLLMRMWWMMMTLQLCQICSTPKPN